jgi:cytochrome c biogenesis protein CcdA/thiol-disulfide isomerase/thioredoxin
MALLIIYAFVSGMVTALTPCVLPILPIVLSSTVTGGRRRPLGVIVGLILSFTFFTLTLTTIIQALHLPADLLRTISIVLLFLFGLTMLIPRFMQYSEILFSKLSTKIGAGQGGQRTGFFGGFLIGLTLGILWAPCAGPILASVITLALTNNVTVQSALITFSYACGTAVILLLIAYGGRGIIARFRALNSKSALIQQVFGVVMILTSFALIFGIDLQFQKYIVQHLPSWALTPLGQFESSESVSKELRNLRGTSGPGRPQTNAGLDSASLLSDQGVAPEFVKPTKWLTADGTDVTMQQLRGKVVLIDFWTYSCINCIRTLPYIEGWQKKYADKGFTVVGVHSPEFAFERVPSNVMKAIRDFGLTYPVVMDNDFGTWNAYNNEYWPAHYLVDAKGHIRFTHFGEGRYEDTERAIQLLLKERGADADFAIASAKPVLMDRALSPETYLGYRRLSSDQLKVAEPVTHSAFSTYSQRGTALPLNAFSFTGSWNIEQEYAEGKKGSILRYHFSGREVNLVMSDKNASFTGSVDTVKIASRTTQYDVSESSEGGYCTDEMCVKGKKAATSGLPVTIRILNSSSFNKGRDLQKGVVSVSDPRLYNLGLFDDVTNATIEIELQEDGVRIYAFTFG